MTIVSSATDAPRGHDGDDAGSAPAAGSWRRDFQLLWGGSAISQLGTMGVAAAGPLLALALTGSPVVAGWVSAAGIAPGLLLHLPAGLAADRYDRWRIMLISQLIRAISAVLLVVGLFTIGSPWPLLVVAAAVDGSCAVFHGIAENAAVQFLVPRDELEESMGKNEARQHMAVTLGRPLGGLLFAVDRAFPYGFDALSSLLSVASLCALKAKGFQAADDRIPDQEHRRTTALRALREGLGQIHRDRFFWVALGACTICNLVFSMVILLLVVQAERRGLSSSFIGALLATSGVSGFLGAILAPRLVSERSLELTVTTCLWMWAALMLIVAVFDQPVIGLIASGLCSFMGAHINVALAVHQSKNVPRRLLGRVEGTKTFLTTGAAAVGALAGGYVITEFGVWATAWLAFAVVVLVAVAVTVLLQRSFQRQGHGQGRTRIAFGSSSMSTDT